MPNPIEELTVKDWMRYLNLNDNIGADTISVIEFIFLWMKYNNWYSQKFKSLNDSKGAIELSENYRAKTTYNKLKNDFLTSFKNIKGGHYLDIERTGVCDNRNNEEIHYDEVADSLRDFLKIIYQIRCNFFHGSKAPDDTNVQLIKWASHCFKKFLYKFEEEDK